jgi:transcriptional regulator with XRE-family HTH domain
MRVDEFASDDGVIAELGQRLAAHRAARNLTQGELADRAGVARSTVQRLERGQSIQLASLVRLLRSLDRLGALDAVLPAGVRSPLAELERERSRRRRRVRHRSGAPEDPEWSWGEEDERG